jgi:hypothetical protein
MRLTEKIQAIIGVALVVLLIIMVSHWVGL